VLPAPPDQHTQPTSPPNGLRPKGS
jgi:hypothetical protein